MLARGWPLVECKLRVFVGNETIEARVERPALLMVELNEKLELKVVRFVCSHRFWVRCIACRFRTLACLAGSLFAFLRSLCLFLARGLWRLAVLLVEEVWLRAHTSLFDDLLQRHLVIEFERAAFTLSAAAVDAGNLCSCRCTTVDSSSGLMVL